MAKPYIHAKSSARRFGGVPEDYLDLHTLLDSSKSCIADCRHRALTHNSWFLFILEKIYGANITNSEGKLVSTRTLGELHILEDYGGAFIPSAQDFLQNIVMEPWMNNEKGSKPSSMKLVNTGRDLGRATNSEKGSD